MQRNNNTLIWAGVIAVALGLMIWGSSAQETAAGTWADTEVACLPGGHQNAINHIHAQLTVSINGEPQNIPANVGVNANCMAEVHTHDASGKIHVETTDTTIDQTLADFFAVWDKPLERDGYSRTLLVNGEVHEGTYVFSDGDVLELRYESVPSSAAEATSTATSS